MAGAARATTPTPRPAAGAVTNGTKASRGPTRNAARLCGWHTSDGGVGCSRPGARRSVSRGEQRPECARGSSIYIGDCQGCLVRHIANMPSRDAGAWIAKLRETKGSAYAEDLKKKVRAKYEQMKAEPPDAALTGEHK